MTDRDELDDVTRIVARANESLDEVLRITGGAQPEPPASPSEADLPDEETRIVERSPGVTSSPGGAAPAEPLDEATRIVDRVTPPADRTDHQPSRRDAEASAAAVTDVAGPDEIGSADTAPEGPADEATRLVDRPQAPADGAIPAAEESTRLVPRVDPLDESTHIVTRIEPDESTRLVTRPATRAERRAEDLRRANELEDSTRIVARPESAEERAARDLAARLAARAESSPNDGPVDDATQLAIRPPEPIVDPDPPARAILPPKTRVISNTQTATFEQTGDERWPTGGAPRIAPLPSPAGEDEGDGSSTPRPRLIDGLPARLQVARWERETELRVVDTAQLHREARAQRRRQAATVLTVIAVVVVGSAAGLAALLLASF